jgi:hypothetical protein
VIIFSLRTKDLEGGGVRYVSSCFYNNSFVSSRVVKIAESAVATMYLMHIPDFLSQICPAIKKFQWNFNGEFLEQFFYSFFEP